MLLLEMISEFLAAICIKVTLEHFKTPQCLQCLDASLRVFSLPLSRHATLSFIFIDDISIRKKQKGENKWEIQKVTNFQIRRFE